MTGAAPAPPLAAIALLSGAALGYEVLLMRLFSIIQWHHFAYLIISVALLGNGAAGSAVTLVGERLLRHFPAAFSAAAALFGVTAIAGFSAAQRVAFNPLELLWDAAQPLQLALVYLCLVLPFFCAGAALCLAFARFGAQSHRVYSADILGAGSGSLAVLGLLYALHPAEALRVVGVLGVGAAAVAALRHSGTLAAVLALGAAALALLLPGEALRLTPSEYKDLTQALRVPGTRVLAQRSSPLGLVTVVESPAIPLRHAPGLSLASPAEPPSQLGLFIDGDGPSAIDRDGPGSDAYLDFLTTALPYHLLARPRVLVLGAGAGGEVRQALSLGASSVDAAEINPDTIDLVQRQFAEFSGAPYSRPGVRLHIAEARAFVAHHPQRYDLIQIALLDAFGAASAGLHGVSESYLYTVEALGDYLDRLEPGGMVAITRWVNLPPRDVLKLFATAVQALERRGVEDPGAHLMLIRSWKTATLLASSTPFVPGQVDATRAFCRSRSFDTEYLPGITAAEANRYNRLDRPHLLEGALALLGPERERYLAQYKFAIEPATDVRPHFFHFFRWRTLPEVLALKDQGGLPLLDWGYPVLVASLVQATVVSVVLILLPLAMLGSQSPQAAAEPLAVPRVALYFLALGLGFMFVEMAFIQKFTLFLGHPLHAAAVVLAAFLVFAGLGSRWSERIATWNAARRGGLFAAIALLGVAYACGLPPLFRQWMGLPDAARIAVSLLLLAPLGFIMGMPFPSGMREVARLRPRLLPWAWGINGFASVVAAILATLLAIHLGFTAVVLLGALLYLLAWASFPRPARSQCREDGAPSDSQVSPQCPQPPPQEPRSR
jgi:spermidine synthase